MRWEPPPPHNQLADAPYLHGTYITSTRRAYPKLKSQCCGFAVLRASKSRVVLACDTYPHQRNHRGLLAKPWLGRPQLSLLAGRGCTWWASHFKYLKLKQGRRRKKVVPHAARVSCQKGGWGQTIRFLRLFRRCHCCEKHADENQHFSAFFLRVTQNHVRGINYFRKELVFVQ